MKITLEELANRIEALEAADYRIDAEIARAMGWAYRRRDVTGHWQWYAPDNDLHIQARPPAYTASIDAAMSLVPEGWWLSSMYFCHPDFRSEQDREWHAEIGGPVTWVTFDGPPEPEYGCEGGNASTPALALCAAALRAIAHTERASS